LGVETRNDFTQDFEPLTGGIALHEGKAGDVPARPRKGCDQTAAHWIAYYCYDNRDRCRYPLRRETMGVTACQNDITLSRTNSEAISPACSMRPSASRRSMITLLLLGSLLRADRERPGGNYTASNGEELAPSHFLPQS
jgi:hypothetical protein